MDKKCVLITGASKGIGRACAFTFARAGYHVFINCRNSVKELEQVQEQILSEGGSCQALPGDMGNSGDVSRIFQQIEASAKGLDVLVNNAGMAYIGLLTDMSDSDWERILHTNLSSVFYCSRAAIPYMVSQKSGKIISISSMWGTCGASCEAAYSATKAGVNGLTKALAKELAPSNVQVNAIACGVIDTGMNAQLSEQERHTLMDEVPAGRFGSPMEVADLVLDLSESHAYLTGQIIGLDGGFL
ncbi:elongation factor P 5-aminopentanone reductase [Faecalicatena contorta]|uniref:3-oxoacyl-[acyl-carrier protein] reductase n=1 Tax=Faecalicatena contorta TaxID=39482 RepID=A0A316AN37_9FIRM|nr:3-oxoacyl-ACP reductase FabG [Faecalicatena contorta]PWJ51457.1 3-oxoacyl-[acyl-carrier protein] reductase [Faecalicatena contorta]SUQ13013.1 3-oxoacyl-[acyl-carrier protein] reductase [Faecalicatena contorta]